MRNAAAVGIQPTTQQQQQQQQQQHIMPPGQTLGGIQLHPGLQYGNHMGTGGQRGVGVGGGAMVLGLGPGGDPIRDVWASNLDQEMEQVRNLITQYPYVSMVSVCAEFGVLTLWCRIQSFRGLLLDLLDSLRRRMSIIIRRCGVTSIYSR